MYSGVLIDLGNTICYNRDFNFNRGLCAIYNKAIKPKVTLKEFLNFTDEFKAVSFEKRDNFEISFRNYLMYLISYFNLEFEINLDEIEEVFSDNFEELVLIDGVIEFLEYLKLNNKKIVILSNSTLSTKTLKRSLEKLNILSYFDKVFSSGDYMFRKPYEEFFNLGIKYFNIDKSSFYYIGNDYYFDMIGATNVGLKAIWFNENNEENINDLNIMMFNKYQDLINILKEEDKNV